MDKTGIKVGLLHGKTSRQANLAPTRVELQKNRLIAYQCDKVQSSVLANYNIVYKRIVTLEKQPMDLNFGFTLQGGREFQSPVKIKKIFENTPASRSGEIHEDDVVLEVNGLPTWGKTHKEVIKKAKEFSKSITLHLGSLQQKETESISSSGGLDEEWVVAAEIPLLMASVTVYERGTGHIRPDGFEVVSSNEEQQLMLFRNGTTQAEDINGWISAISGVIKTLNKQEVEKWNSWSELDIYEKIAYMETVHELLPSNTQTKVWKAKALVLTEKQLIIFNSLPNSIDGWQRPEVHYKLQHLTTKVLKNPKSIHLEQTVERACSILIQSGTGSTHTLSFECQNDLEHFIRELHKTTIKAVNDMKNEHFEADWNERRVNFTLDIEKGFIIEDSSDHAVLWTKPFSRLKKSSNDGVTELKLEFIYQGSEFTETLVLKIEDLHIALCSIEAFIFAKTVSLDAGYIRRVFFLA